MVVLEHNVTITINPGLTLNPGTYIALTPLSLVTNGILLNFDAASYTGQTTGPQQNVSGTSDNIGFFPYGWDTAPPTGFGNIQPGWVCDQTGAVVTVVDAISHVITTVGTPFASGNAYTFTGPWIDGVNGVLATPYNVPAWSSDNGGTFLLTAPAVQYFSVPWPTFQPTFTIDMWFNFTDNQAGDNPCLLSDEFTGAPFNFTINASADKLLTGWYTTNWTGQYADNNVGAPLVHDGSTWYNLIMSVGATEYKDYINGAVSYAPGNFGGGAAPNGSSPTQRFFIGHRWDLEQTVNAKIAVVNIYDRALSDAEAAQNFAHYKARFGL